MTCNRFRVLKLWDVHNDQTHAFHMVEDKVPAMISNSSTPPSLMVSGGRTLILFGRCQCSRLTGLWCQCPAEDPGTETRIPLHWWPGLSKSFSVCLFIFIWALCVIVFASSVTGFSWPAEAMGSCWSCLYRDPIRDNHLTKFKVRNPPKSCICFFFFFFPPYITTVHLCPFKL